MLPEVKFYDYSILNIVVNFILSKNMKTNLNLITQM